MYENDEIIPKVGIVESDFESALQNIKKLIRAIDYKPKKKNILIKPNIVGMYPPESAIVTSPKVVEALILYLKTHYPEKKIIIGEGSSRPDRIDRVFEISGYKKLARRYNVELHNFDDTDYEPIRWKHGVIDIPKLIFSHEYINVAKMKTHTQTTVSLCMKNQKGIIRKKDRKRFHNKLDLQRSIAELTEIVKPDLNIVDGITAIEGNGPTSAGKKKTCNVLIASKNIYATDNAAVRIMGFAIDEVKHIPEFTNYIETEEKINNIRKQFEKPTNPVIVPGYNFACHYDEAVCSFCSVNFESALSSGSDNAHFMEQLLQHARKYKNIGIVMGKSLPDANNYEKTICYGECAYSFSQRNGLPIIHGCPPKIQDIRNDLLYYL